MLKDSAPLISSGTPFQREGALTVKGPLQFGAQSLTWRVRVKVSGHNGLGLGLGLGLVGTMEDVGLIPLAYRVKYKHWH